MIPTTVSQEIATDLTEEIRPWARQHGVTREALARAVTEAQFEVEQKGEIASTPEEIHSNLLELIVWRLFSRQSDLWITSKTAAGNRVPLDLLVAAYTMWRRAVRFAAEYDVGRPEVAEVLAENTHATADYIAKRNRESGDRIRDIDRYLFASFITSIAGIARKRGPKHQIREASFFERCDEGAFQQALESSVLCRELLNVMPRQARRVAMARYLMGYEWPEVADVFETSVNAAKKAQSVGLRKAFETCRRKFGKVTGEKADGETTPMRKDSSGE